MKSAQERGLIMVASLVRDLIPPQLEAVILVYRPENPGGSMSSTMATVGNVDNGPAQIAAVERAKLAAAAFVAQSPNAPGFNPQS